MSAHPPEWKLLRERSARDYRIFRTRTLDVADPRNGTEYIRTVIDAPDWLNVVALTPNDDFILVRQFRFGTWANSLEIPGGIMDPGEDAQTGAARELEEETGYRPAKLTLLGVSHPNPAIQGNRLHSFLASGCVKVNDGHPDGSEDIRVELLSREAVRDAVLRAEMTHSLVLTALLYEAWTR